MKTERGFWTNMAPTEAGWYFVVDCSVPVDQQYPQAVHLYSYDSELRIDWQGNLMRGKDAAVRWFSEPIPEPVMEHIAAHQLPAVEQPSVTEDDLHAQLAALAKRRGESTYRMLVRHKDGEFAGTILESKIGCILFMMGLDVLK